MPKFSGRLKTLSSISQSSIHQSLATPASHAAMARARASAAAHSDPSNAMEMMRSLLQKSINEDIKQVLGKYVEKFFAPGYRNAVNNLGEENVSSSLVQTVCISALEHAKDIYKPIQRPRASDNPEAGTSHQGNAAISKRKFDPNNGSAPPKKKKKKKRKGGHEDGEDRPPKPNTDLILVSKTGRPVRREGALWDPTRFDRPGMLFILGSRANKALGYGQTRGRLYIKHPEIFKYSGDQEDKEWLAKRGLMSTTGGKAYLMILSDILDLAASPDYVKHPRGQPQELVGFPLPKFITDKMRCFMGHLRTDPALPESDLLAYAEQKFSVWEVERKRLTGFAATASEPVGEVKKREEEFPAVVAPHYSGLGNGSGEADEEEKKKVQEILNEIKKEETRLNPVSAANPALDTAALPQSHGSNPGISGASVAVSASGDVPVVDLGFLHGMNLNNLVREFEEMGQDGGTEHHLSGILSLADDEGEVVGFPDFQEDVVEVAGGGVAGGQDLPQGGEFDAHLRNMELATGLRAEETPMSVEKPAEELNETVSGQKSTTEIEPECSESVSKVTSETSGVTTRAGSSKANAEGTQTAREPLKITDSSNSSITQPIEDLNQMDFPQ